MSLVLVSMAVPAVAQQCEWSPVDSGMNSSVHGLTVFDDLTIPALYGLYVGGAFTMAGGVAANNIAKWDGTQWSPLGSGMSGGGSFPSVPALTVFDDGTGSALYAGGDFTMAGGVSVNRIAKWDGTQWLPLGSGMSGGGFPSVSALTVFDDVTVPALYGLYAGGDFAMAGGVAANFIAKWNGTQWSPLGSGMNDGVRALTVFDDVTVPALYGLYAGGLFFRAGGVPANFIAKWNGIQWSPLGGGMNGSVFALTVFDDGTGPALYAGGAFTRAGGMEANNIAKWNGTQWSRVGNGLGGGGFSVRALTVFDEGTGPALYAGGDIDTPVRTRMIAKWNGTQWSSIGIETDECCPRVFALTVFNNGTGSALYAGGEFTMAGGVPANFIANWSCAAP